MVTFLIRHAAVEASDRLGRRDRVRLSANGQMQARALAERFNGVEMDAIFSSPILRARQTAEAIARGNRVIIEDALREVEVGEWDGKTFAELDAIESWKWFNQFRSGVRAPGGEMMLEVQARAVGFLERVAWKYRNKQIVAVSHADVIRGVICHYLGIPLDLSLRVRIDPASVSILRISECGAEILGLNEGGQASDPPFIV
jgi:probable phosphoglycerate mutase